MPLTIASDQLRQIEDAQEELLLGIILEDDSVRLRRAERTTIIGHLEWLAIEPIQNVKRGFSVGVKEGRVVSLFPMSRLNPDAFGRLEDGYVQDLTALLPKADGFRVFRY